MIPIQAQTGISTNYQLFSINPKTGIETKLTEKFGNKILISGKNQMAIRNWFIACQVGTDSTAPLETHTALLGYVAGTGDIQEQSYGAQGSAPYFGWKRKRFRFPIGTVVGNISEVGIGWDTAAGDTIVTRALIVDIAGAQTTITMLPDEFLDVVVEIRYYPPLADLTGQVTFDGIIYDYIIRAANVTSAEWGRDCGDKIAGYAWDVTHWMAYDGDINSIDLGPSGLTDPSDNVNEYALGYVTNSFQVTIGMIVGPGGWNLLTGKNLRSLLVRTTIGLYQIQFDNNGIGVPKTDMYNIKVEFLLGWLEKL